MILLCLREVVVAHEWILGELEDAPIPHPSLRGEYPGRFSMETVVRVTIVYVFLIIGLRVLGKREFGQMSPLELLTLLLIPKSCRRPWCARIFH